MYVATPLSQEEYKPYRVLFVLSSVVFAYKTKTMFDADEVVTVGKRRNVFLQFAIADHVVMVIMHFLERA